MAAYVSGNNIKPGFVIKYNNQLYRVMAAEHRTPGNKRAFCQAKLRNLKDGTQTEVKFRADEGIERASLEQKEMEYLYQDPSGHCFMDCETYEQLFIEEEMLKDALKYMLPNTRIVVELYDGKPIGVTLQDTVELLVTDTEPPMKGATASGSGKPATLETGLVVNVPQFVEVGERVKVSTVTGTYLERVK
ncbi:MAG: elongation factor P [Nitrospinae bacterium CG11_big_fil_rev_8_21_14_0_20_56_8]|nr:MAG: elongation factor P [Nitrospinae bacterium CG11_big_fil_rev_8_21_14_0_20_56_8]